MSRLYKRVSNEQRTASTREQIEALMPSNELMRPAWLANLRYCIDREDMLAAFRYDTGCNWKPGRTPIERMIDETCGADVGFLLAFIKWVNQNLWGEVDGRACNGDEGEAIGNG